MSDNALVRALMSFGQGASNAVASNVSAPVDGLAWLLRKGGLPIPANPVGGSDWMAQKGLTAVPQNKLAGLLGETVGMVGPALVQAAAPKIAGGLLALDDHAMEMARRGVEGRMDVSGMRQNMFIGPSAKTWDAGKAKQAQEMLDKGVPPEQVWSQTGTFRGADGKLRQEIDDSAALFNPRVVNGAKVETGLQNGSPVDLGPTVGGLLEHRPLQDAYGGVTGSTYIGNKNTMFGDGVQGAFDAADNRLTINAPASANDAKSTALHELQHAIQQREGFARGGSPSQFAGVSAESQKSLDEINAILNSGKYSAKEYQTLLQQKRDILNNSAPGLSSNEQYRRLAGETEARLTQSRMGMNPMQRAASFPPSMFDVPIEQQIVRFK